MTLATLEALSVAPNHCQAQAWAGSTVVHVLFVCLAILLITDLQPTSQSEPLRLDIAFIQPAPPEIHKPLEPQELPKPTPVQKQIVPEKVIPPTPVQQPIMKREPVIEPLPTTKAQEVHHPETVPMPRQQQIQDPVQAKPILESTPTEQEVVLEPVKHILSPSTHSKSVEQAKPIQQRETTLAQRAEPSPQTLPTPVTEVREMVESPMQTTLVAARVTESVSHEPVHESVPTTRPETSVQPQAVQTKAEVVEPTVPVAQEKKIARERPVPQIHQRTAAVERPTQAYPEVQADYGWLAQTIWSQIEKYKSYPTKARQMEWEGRVVLEAVIRQDGTILHLRVAETSGHEILDKDALSLLWKLSPLALDHALGHPQITILVPLTYQLDG